MSGLLLSQERKILLLMRFVSAKAHSQRMLVDETLGMAYRERNGDSQRRQYIRMSDELNILGDFVFEDQRSVWKLKVSRRSETYLSGTPGSRIFSEP